MREPAGFRDFVTVESPRLLRSARLLTRDWQRAEDLLQTVIVKALPRWEDIRDPVAYLRTAMVRETLRARSRRWTGELPHERVPEVPGHDQMSAADTHLALLGALDTLSPQQRAVIVLRYFDDLSEAESADILGCSVGTVKSQAHRAIAALRAHPALQSMPVFEGMLS